MKTVFVVGAGPAGMFAAQKIAFAGFQVIIFNRDIKPGGLAEYGIYPEKDKMKLGLRKQFAKVLSLPNVHYFGGVAVGSQQKITIDDLLAYKPAAIVFANGAQGYKKLGLPGEDAKGVYSAKDFVYFYNQLPPYSTQDFSCGKKVAIVGMGNVMVDIARWVLQDDPKRICEEVTVVARRGPFEAKFDEKEIKHIDMHMDAKDLLTEMERVKDKVAAVGQDVANAGEIFPLLKQPYQPAKMPRLKFRFLCGPKEIIKGADGRMSRLVVTENLLVKKGEGTAAKGTDQTATLDIDTLIFAIGDAHDPNFGLPMGPEGYSTKPVDGNERSKYQVVDPQSGAELAGFFVVGWSRRASDGLVGIARHDAEVGATYAIEYAQAVTQVTNISADDIETNLRVKGVRLVNKPQIEKLNKIEEIEAKQRGLAYFKYPDNESMLRAIENGIPEAVTAGSK